LIDMISGLWKLPVRDRTLDAVKEYQIRVGAVRGFGNDTKTATALFL
jgi:hypothetical protein